ncbi:MAG: InlB B-repeat-containing protein [Bacteroidales bacterium]|nr:InlB B-repeat-containing protein [Bacteroidales bacterium]
MKQFLRNIRLWGIGALFLAVLGTSYGQGHGSYVHRPAIDTTACDSLYWLNRWLTASGSYCDTVSTTDGETIYNLNLTLRHSTEASENITGCDNIVWNNTSFTTSGTYRDTLTNSQGCDSLISLHVVVHHSSIEVQRAVACEQYTWYGTTYRKTSVQRTHLTNVYNCDSLLVLNLTILHGTVGYQQVHACNNYTWIDGQSYATSGNYSTRQYRGSDGTMHPFVAANGCDSTAVLQLTVDYSKYANERITACDSLVWHDSTTYYESTTSYATKPTYTTTGSNGCDSTTTLLLTIGASYHGAHADTVNIAQLPWSYGGTTFSAPVSATTIRITRTNGCDSVIDYSLTVRGNRIGSADSIVCNNHLPLLWNGVSFYGDSSATVVLAGLGPNGEDSILTMNVRVHYTTASPGVRHAYMVENALPYYFCGYAITPTVQDTVLRTNLVNAADCDSTVTVTLHVWFNVKSTVDTAVCPSEMPLTWHGFVFNEVGTRYDTLTARRRQDSIVAYTVSLFSNTTATIADTVVENFLPHTFLSDSFENDTACTFLIANANGCDSVINYSLVVLYNTQDTVDMLICNNADVTRDTMYTTTYHALNGTDSVVVTRVATRPMMYGNRYATACGELRWPAPNGTVERSATPTDTLTASNGCDSIVTLQLTTYPATARQIRAVACDSLVWNNETYRTSGSYHDTLTDRHGCDSLVVMNITINHPTSKTIALTSCGNLSWNGMTYTSNATASQTLTAANGCDSVVTANITIIPNHYINYHANGGGGTMPRQTGCDGRSITLLGNIFVNRGYQFAGWGTLASQQSPTYTDGQTITLNNDLDLYAIWDYRCADITNYTAIRGCDTLTWRGSIYTFADFGYNGAMITVSDTIHDVVGEYCDSIYIALLTFYTSYNTDTTVHGCDSLIWNDSTYHTSTTFTWSDTTADNCPNNTTVQLVIDSSTHSSVAYIVCDSLLWGGMPYHNDGTYTSRFASQRGCDSIVTMRLAVNHSVHDTTRMSACDSLLWKGILYDHNTAATDTLTTIQGCDSIVANIITIEHATLSIDTVTTCDRYTWYNDSTYRLSTTDTLKLTTIGGCDSTLILSLTIKHSKSIRHDTSFCDAYYPFRWRNHLFTQAGIITDRYRAANGCDSTISYNLHAKKSSTGSDMVSACGSYTWQDSVYTRSTTLQYNHLTNTDGCDSSFTLLILIREGTSQTRKVSACDSYVWNDGTAYHESTTRYDTLPSTSGCDSIIATNIIVYHSSLINYDIHACDSFMWNGLVFYHSDHRTFDMGHNAQGCDSTVTIALHMHRSYRDTTVKTAYSTLWWEGRTYANSGTYTVTYPTVDGCDSSLTLILHILRNAIDQSDEAAAAVNVYPNPTTGPVTVYCDAMKCIEVYDQQGRGVMTHHLPQQTGSARLDLSSLPSGLYTLRISSHTGTCMARVMKR